VPRVKDRLAKADPRELSENDAAVLDPKPQRKFLRKPRRWRPNHFRWGIEAFKKRFGS